MQQRLLAYVPTELTTLAITNKNALSFVIQKQIFNQQSTDSKTILENFFRCIPITSEYSKIAFLSHNDSSELLGDLVKLGFNNGFDLTLITDPKMLDSEYFKLLFIIIPANNLVRKIIKNNVPEVKFII